MQLKYFLFFKTKLILIWLVFTATMSWGQAIQQKKRPRGNPEGEFANTQWWIGLKGGINLGKASPTERYQVFESLENGTNFDKKYKSFTKLGFVFGATVSFNFYKGLSVVTSPDYSVTRYMYENTYSWQSSISSVSLRQQHVYTHHYVSVPLLLKMDFMRRKLRPYAQAGIGYAMRTQSTKNTTFTSTDASTGGSNVVENDNPRAGVDNQFIRSQIFIPMGVGVAYDVGNVRLAFEVSYIVGLSNITNRKLRFADDRFTASGDVPDDVKLHQLDIQLAVAFPMKFLRSQLFKSVNP